MRPAVCTFLLAAVNGALAYWFCVGLASQFGVVIEVVVGIPFSLAWGVISGYSLGVYLGSRGYFVPATVGGSNPESRS